ncbi:MAG: transglutaminase family protein [Actinomycetes bacterium]
MSWRLSIQHRTSYRYEAPVIASFNEVRMTPASNADQYLIHHGLYVSPNAHINRFRDYWGTDVETFDLQTPHETLEVVSDNLVEVSRPKAIDHGCTWNELRHDNVRDRFFEYTQHTTLTDQLDTSKIAIEKRSPREFALHISELVNSQIAYIPGQTNVHTSASQSFAAKVGVCQDFTHVTLSLLRSFGIPARYVSGYLFHGSQNLGISSIGESHSWVEAWVGDWLAIDPTNQRDVDESHITVAKGRDYSDVSPLIGIYSGGASREVSVEVTITRQA